MNVRTINMGSHDKCVFSLGESHGCLIPDLVRLLRRDFSGLKGLPNLICNHIMRLGSTGDMLILPFRKQKFFITGLCVTGIRADIFSIFRLCCILRIISTVSQTLRYRLSFIDMQRNSATRSLPYWVLSVVISPSTISGWSTK